MWRAKCTSRAVPATLKLAALLIVCTFIGATRASNCTRPETLIFGSDDPDVTSCTGYADCGEQLCQCAAGSATGGAASFQGGRCLGAATDCSLVRGCLDSYMQCANDLADFRNDVNSSCYAFGTMVHAWQLDAAMNGYAGSEIQASCGYRVCTILNASETWAGGRCDIFVDNYSDVCFPRGAATTTLPPSTTTPPPTTMATTTTPPPTPTPTPTTTNASTTTTTATATTMTTATTTTTTTEVPSSTAPVPTAVSDIVRAEFTTEVEAAGFAARVASRYGLSSNQYSAAVSGTVVVLTFIGADASALARSVLDLPSDVRTSWGVVSLAPVETPGPAPAADDGISTEEMLLYTLVPIGGILLLIGIIIGAAMYARSRTDPLLHFQDWVQWENRQRQAYDNDEELGLLNAPEREAGAHHGERSGGGYTPPPMMPDDDPDL